MKSRLCADEWYFHFSTRGALFPSSEVVSPTLDRDRRCLMMERVTRFSMAFGGGPWNFTRKAQDLVCTPFVQQTIVETHQRGRSSAVTKPHVRF